MEDGQTMVDKSDTNRISEKISKVVTVLRRGKEGTSTILYFRQRQKIHENASTSIHQPDSTRPITG